MRAGHDGPTTSVTLRNGTLIDPVKGTESAIDLTLLNGRWVDEPAPPGTVEFDARDCLLCPGFTDLYTRLREPGHTRKGTIDSETRAAVQAGFTRVLCAPDTHPVIDTRATVELIRHRAELSGHAQVLPMAALTVGLEGKRLAELATLRDAGCVAASHADVCMADTQVLFNAIEYAASVELPVLLNARDAWLGVEGCAHAGQHAGRLGLPGIPRAAETLAIARLIELCRASEYPIHLSRISTAQSVQLIRRARDDGLPITCDVGILHLYLTHECLQSLDPVFHSAVPFRASEDRDALRGGLLDGVIDAICSDHAPHDADAKLAPFQGSEPGLSVYDTFLPLLLRLRNQLPIGLPELIDKVAVAPLRVLGMDDSLARVPNAGADADLVIMQSRNDSGDEARMTDWLSAGRNSPWCKDMQAHAIGQLPELPGVRCRGTVGRNGLRVFYPD